mmetsp:Transcript_465/g.1285  ORF Transcript_465/g.1285 Transcript_465/m.1285 type:complete len:332 (+) Transcript_465:803-1798(+)
MLPRRARASSSVSAVTWHCRDAAWSIAWSRASTAAARNDAFATSSASSASTCRVFSSSCHLRDASSRGDVASFSSRGGSDPTLPERERRLWETASPPKEGCSPSARTAWASRIFTLAAALSACFFASSRSRAFASNASMFASNMTLFRVAASSSSAVLCRRASSNWASDRANAASNAANAACDAASRSFNSRASSSRRRRCSWIVTAAWSAVACCCRIKDCASSSISFREATTSGDDSALRISSRYNLSNCSRRSSSLARSWSCTSCSVASSLASIALMNFSSATLSSTGGREFLLDDVVADPAGDLGPFCVRWWGRRFFWCVCAGGGVGL